MRTAGKEERERRREGVREKGRENQLNPTKFLQKPPHMQHSCQPHVQF